MKEYDFKALKGNLSPSIRVPTKLRDLDVLFSYSEMPFLFFLNGPI